MTFNELINEIIKLQDEGLELFSVGKSVLGKNILATHVGSYSGNQVVFQAGIHGREYITSLLLVELAKYTSKQYIESGGIYFIFLTNPDGAQIVLDGVNILPCEVTKQYLILANNGDSNFSQYKANVNLVDLNTNFNARWGGGAQNVFCPSTENFVGFYPESEREVQNLINFTLKNKPLITISYHSKGEIIYYGFEGESAENISRDRQIGEELSASTGYSLIFTENSTGGYKDWCINSLQIPSYTIEVGSENLTHPIGKEHLPEIFEKNKNVPLLTLSLANKYAKNIDFKNQISQNKIKEKENESNENGYLARLQSYARRRDSNRRCYYVQQQDNSESPQQA